MASRNLSFFIEHPTRVLPFLRNFGYILKKLYINFSRFSVKLGAKIEYYLAEYCSESLHELSVACNSSIIRFEGLHKTLAHVKTLNIYISGGNNLIPSQLVIKHLPKLKYVYIENYSRRFQDSETLHYDNIEYFTINSVSKITKFPFSFNKLKHMIFIHFDINDEWCQWIRSMESLTTLKLLDISINDEKCLSNMLQSQNLLSNIEELLIELNGFYKWDTNAILRFLERSRNLSTLALLRIRKHKTENLNFSYEEVDIITEKIISNLNCRWKFHVIDPFRNPFGNVSIFGQYYDCYVIKKVTEGAD